MYKIGELVRVFDEDKLKQYTIVSIGYTPSNIEFFWIKENPDDEDEEEVAVSGRSLDKWNK